MTRSPALPRCGWTAIPKPRIKKRSPRANVVLRAAEPVSPIARAPGSRFPQHAGPFPQRRGRFPDLQTPLPQRARRDRSPNVRSVSPNVRAVPPNPLGLSPNRPERRPNLPDGCPPGARGPAFIPRGSESDRAEPERSRRDLRGNAGFALRHPGIRIQKWASRTLRGADTTTT
jgi:hypothetical protein